MFWCWCWRGKQSKKIGVKIHLRDIGYNVIFFIISHRATQRTRKRTHTYTRTHHNQIHSNSVFALTYILAAVEDFLIWIIFETNAIHKGRTGIRKNNNINCIINSSCTVRNRVSFLLCFLLLLFIRWNEKKKYVYKFAILFSWKATNSR